MPAASLHNDFLLDSEKNVTSERPIALLSAMIRWWEALRAPEVAKWQHKDRIEWDTTDGRNGGAQRTVWETLLGMDRYHHAGEKERLRWCLIRRQPWRELAFQSCGLGRRISTSPQRSCVCYAASSNTSGGYSSKDVWRIPLQTITAISPCVKVELLAPAHCAAGRSE